MPSVLANVSDGHAIIATMQTQVFVYYWQFAVGAAAFCSFFEDSSHG